MKKTFRQIGIALVAMISTLNMEASTVYDYGKTPICALNNISRYSAWGDLIGKKLTLIKYGLVGDDGREANVFYNNTGEYIMLRSNGILVWNNRGQDGDTSYYYHIIGNKVYFGTSKESKQNYFEIISTGTNTIKTHDNLGTYRYFSY